MHCWANEAVAPVNDTATAPSATPPARANAMANLANANFITVVFMFILHCSFVPRPIGLAGRLLQRTIL
jgi:hypothetical protein